MLVSHASATHVNVCFCKGPVVLYMVKKSPLSFVTHGKLSVTRT